MQKQDFENPENLENLEENNNQKVDENSKEISEQGEKEKQEQKILELQNKLEEANDRTLRALAELENSKRLAKQEIEKTIKYSISKFVSDLIVVSENFFLASSNSPIEEIEKNQLIKNYVNAINMTEKELMKTLEKHGVKRIYPLKEKFDHNFHEAISQIESAEDEEGTILQVIQAGYSLNDRLIKPALVAVAK